MKQTLKQYRDRLLSPVLARLNIIDDRLQCLVGETESDEAAKESQRCNIEEKWRAMDCLEKALPEDLIIHCDICGADFKRNETDKFISKCIFGGGELIRYRCPECGAIIGPLKMLFLSESALSEDYARHYSVYNEGDSTEREIRSFYALKPKKSGVYLNYGAGCWSKTITNLRAEGWNVYGFEPYSIDVFAGRGVNVHDKKTLATMKFDGIFSNDLLEHLRYPVEDIAFMCSLLKDGGLMSHTTPCYDYAFEYTRFHLFFYTGNSVQKICEQLKLSVISSEQDYAKGYINYTFQNTQ